jgi:pyridoxine 4-dehydrogenase
LSRSIHPSLVVMTTVLKHKIGPVGYGLMGLTRPIDPPSQKQSFAAMNAALECGCNYWNGGEFYGTSERNSLHLLNEYFTEYPEKASQVLLTIKGGRTPGKFEFDGTAKGVRRSVDECLRVLNGKKTLDIFECARVDPNTPIEETIGVLAELVKEGKIGGIGLSEVKAETIRRAAKVHPIAQVEVELSLWSPNVLYSGVADACAELGIPLMGYAPLSRGGLSGSLPTSTEELPAHLKIFPRFQGNALKANLRLTEEVGKLAKKKGCSNPQLAISWVRGLSQSNGRGVIIPVPGAEREEWVRENVQEIALTEEDINELIEIALRMPIAGERYGGEVEKLNDG